jgi:hypothetical protein
MQQASLVYSTAKAFFSIPMAGVRLAMSVGKVTANVASAMVYGGPAPAPPPTRAAQQSERVHHVGDDEDERTTLLRTPEPESPAGASPHCGLTGSELFADELTFSSSGTASQHSPIHCQLHPSIRSLLLLIIPLDEKLLARQASYHKRRLHSL